MGQRATLACWLLVVVCVATSPAVAVAAASPGPTDTVAGSSAPNTGLSVTETPTERTAIGVPGTERLPTSAIGTGTVAPQTADPETTPGISLAVSRVGSAELEISVTYDVPAAVEDLRVVAGSVEVRGTEGFERCGSNRLCWDGSTEPTLTVSYDLSARGGTYTGIVDDTAVFVPAPRLYTVWRTDENRRTAPLFAKDEYASYAVAGERTVVGNATLFYGAHTAYERVTDNGTTFRLVVPDGVQLGPSRAGLFDALAGGSRELDVGGENREVIAVALADTAGGMEAGLAGAAIGNAFWARAGASLSSTHNVWLHEYVHTRQRFTDRDREMEWFIEASAEYYAARLSYELGLVGDIEYEWETKSRRVSAGNAVLADPMTWDRPRVPYRKGALTLAALDTEIRNRTDGEHTLEDVFRRLNGDEGTLTYESFVETVVAVSDDPTLEGWLDRYVRGPEAPQYEPVEPRSRLPSAPQVDAVTTLIPTTPIGFAVAAAGLVVTTMLTLSVLSAIGRTVRRLVEAIFDGLGWLADLLSGRYR